LLISAALNILKLTLFITHFVVLRASVYHSRFTYPLELWA